MTRRVPLCCTLVLPSLLGHNSPYRVDLVPEHRKMAAQLSRCRFCFENPDISKHLIIAIGMKASDLHPLSERTN